MGLGLGMGLDVWLGVNRFRDGVRAGGGVLFFLRNSPSPKQVENCLVRKN